MSKERNEEINLSTFKNIHIHFHDDVYLLAVWIAMSDRARSTPTQQSHTTLNGLANKFASAYDIDCSNPLSSDLGLDLESQVAFRAFAHGRGADIENRQFLAD